MGRRGTAAAEATSGSSLADEVADLGPSGNTFTDPLRAETPERDAPDVPPSAPPSAPPGSPSPDVPPDDVGGGGAEGAAFDPQEFRRLREELTIQQRRSDLLEREIMLRNAQQAQAAQPAVPSATAQPKVDPILQECIDILQVTEDDLIEVFTGGAKAAQIVSRALQTACLLAVNAAERRLLGYYAQDQQNRSQTQLVENRAQQMHEAFWGNYPELQPYQELVNYFAGQVAAEQAHTPRFDWNSAQAEVARRTIERLNTGYGQRVAVASGVGAARPAPTLQSRLRPAFGEMGGGISRAGITPSAQQALTNEILDLGRGH
jgi:hypothetical protein